MELGGAFRLGGDVDDTFVYGLNRILAGLGAPIRWPVSADTIR